jgi:hypothetical protein
LEVFGAGGNPEYCADGFIRILFHYGLRQSVSSSEFRVSSSKQ